jgi:hypothetical protein
MINGDALPRRAPATPEVEPAPPETMLMDGWYRDLVASDRDPLMTREEVAKQWGLDYGHLVGKYVLPARDNYAQRASDPDYIEDQAKRTVYVFDGRESQHAPPRFVVASHHGLEQVMGQPSRLRRLWARVSGEVHELYTGENLRMGDGYGRWLPRALRRQERQAQRQGNVHQGRRVISKDQVRFYIGEDRELHVRAEGYNSGAFLAYPNAAERAHKKGVKEREVQWQKQIAASQAGRAAMAAPHPPAEYPARHRRASGMLVR